MIGFGQYILFPYRTVVINLYYANEINNFFCAIGPNFAEKIEHISNKRPEDFFHKKVIPSIYFEPPALTEKFDQIMALKDKAVGHDNISSFFLKAARHVITPYLHQLIDYSFNERIFPNSCKIARIAPIYKTGAEDETNNYRPISILTCISKIIEKIIYARLIKFTKKHQVIHANQYGFQSKVSTMHAMLDVVNSSYNQIYSNQFTALAFIDLKKAFDTVSHSILLNKLRNYGIRDMAHTLIRSYLTNRKRFVSINQIRSDLKGINYGVPQGSSLGQLFFLLYIDDLANAVESTPRLFVDDTCLLISAPNPLNLQNKITQELERLNMWCSVNKLTINLSKTFILIIPLTLAKSSNLLTSLNVTRNDTPMTLVSGAKYLGVFIDDKLLFKEQIKVLEVKVARSVGILCKLKHVLPRKTLLQLYHALIHPLLTYGIIIWGATFSSFLTKLKTLQNKALRVISGAHYRGNALQLYKEYKVLQLDNLYAYETSKFVYCCLQKQVPTPFLNYFTKVCETTQRTTRQSIDELRLHIPQYSTNRLQRSIKYQGVKVWSAIPKEIKSLKFKEFKVKFKEYLLSKYGHQ